jgi:hypothetical protein
MLSLNELIRHLKLEKHPEGGYFRLVYEDHLSVGACCLPSGYKGNRSICNAIYYALPSGGICTLHKVRMNELWNFCIGSPIDLYIISPEGALSKITLGSDLSAWHNPMYVVQAGHWVGARARKNCDFSLATCVTAPGFTFKDWEKGERTDLMTRYPELKQTINMLTE